jgi:DNA polymerase-4
MRKIIHIDMDAFYASVEQRDFPEYKGKPVVVGGAPERRGVVAAASYEARKYGIHSAMSSALALRKCQNLIFLKPRFEVYKEISLQIRQIFFEYTNLVEPLSLDEAYLDVTENKKQMTSATQIAREIRERIFATTSLTASAGVSFNKFLAKVASGYRKPNGMTVIKPEQAEDFLNKLSIEDFYGVGKATAQRMKELGIHHGADLRTWEQEDLMEHFGKHGRYYYQVVRGIDQREVEPERERKSLGAEETFDRDYISKEEMRQQLKNIAEDVAQRLTKHQLAGKSITLKIKFADFSVMSRSKTLLNPIYKEKDLFQTVTDMLYHIELHGKPVRLLGISLSNLSELGKTPAKPEQLNLNW